MAALIRFELIREQEIPEINGTARIYRHVKTGAELLSIITDDENKSFGITFRTPPPDGTGLPHILEHAVLDGSRKYPVKEPFVELLKGSLATFLNAFTYPDKTVYPVASQNVQDFYNLVDVYLDAVFHPRITRHIFEQEGWHYELNQPDEPLKYKGVVLNEMKGAYSSPDRLIGEFSQHSLFPENAYGVDSGGDPKQIPRLTYEQFLEFHRTYYHPSNSRIYFYGDDDPEKRLAILDEYLREFKPIPVDSSVSLHPRFDGPKQITRTYEAGEETDQRRGMVTINWLLRSTANPEVYFALAILGHILIGTPASPLRKALIESGLGEELVGAGLETDLREVFFSTGLKGIRPADSGKVEDLVHDTLESLVHDGIHPDTIEGSLNTVEFALRENNTGSFPRGLALMLRALKTWLYDADPLTLLAFERPLEAIKNRLAREKKYFEELIRENLLENPHRTTVLLEPEAGLGEREAAAEKETLASARQGMSSEELTLLVENTRVLKHHQETPDPPEALATIPRLQLSDLDPKIKTIPIDVTEHAGAKILYHDLFTNGIVYADVGFNLHTLPQRCLPYVSLFGRGLLEMGTEKEDFVTLLQRIGRKTGGIHQTLFASSVEGSPVGVTRFFLRGKATVPQAGELFDILHDMLTSVRLDNRDRFRQMVHEEKASLEGSLSDAGHSIVLSRLRAHFSEADWLVEQTGGISYLFFLRRLAELIESDWPRVLSELEEVRRILLHRKSMVCNVTLDHENMAKVDPQIRAFIERMPDTESSLAEWSPEHPPAPEGLTIPAQVNYVGKAANLYELGYQYHGSAAVVSRYLSRTWLWDRVRVQGGAYGGFCRFDRRSGVFGFASYRDPNLLETLEIYDRTAEYLRNLDLSSDELTKAIIGAIGDLDAYQLPDAKGYTSMAWHLAGETDEDRQRRRDEVLSTTAADFRTFGEALARVEDTGLVAVLGSPAAIEAANQERNGLFKVTKVL